MEWEKVLDNKQLWCFYDFGCQEKEYSSVQIMNSRHCMMTFNAKLKVHNVKSTIKGVTWGGLKLCQLEVSLL